MAKITPVVAARLKALRLARGLSLEELSERIGVGESQLRKMEAGERQASLDNYEAIALELGVTLADLFALEPRTRTERRVKVPA
jgi:transcriptional regulator with XRE-family HTH domain